MRTQVPSVTISGLSWACLVRWYGGFNFVFNVLLWWCRWSNRLESQITYRKCQKLKNAKGNMNTFLHCVWNKDIQYACLIGEWWWNNCYAINLYMCIVSIFIHRHHHKQTNYLAFQSVTFDDYSRNSSCPLNLI
jgi:hypothetical protein